MPRSLQQGLWEIATGYAGSRFAADLAGRDSALRAAFAGRRALIIGGAGSIGESTLRALLPYGPTSIHVIDQNENGLAELARDLRSTGEVPRSLDLRLAPLDYGNAAAERFVREEGPYDVVLHFAALKHVRSEKDVPSILQMLDTNVLKQRRLLEWLADVGAPTRYFAVSTDKAANPANFMGASKRLMELLIFTNGVTPVATSTVSSARFANVAFSAGSLLDGWTHRLRLRQPVAVPRDTRRFFVNLREAAEICLLAAVCIPGRHLAVPRLTEEGDARDLLPIAEAVVAASGYRPVTYTDEDEARAALETDIAAGRWPVLLTPRDTEGEKEVEQFVGSGENEVDVGFQSLRVVPQVGVDPGRLLAVLDELEHLATAPRQRIAKDRLTGLLNSVMPDFQPISGRARLDTRM